ncbi:MAG: tRNA preQ1(34) S-adenosylmethionine ribosyltransferase-isomerase QueA, partial [Bacteroidetes bacterium]
MKLSQYKFNLPPELVAKFPAKNRDESRLMVLHRETEQIEHLTFKDVINYFDDRDVMVFNDTKVFP